MGLMHRRPRGGIRRTLFIALVGIFVVGALPVTVAAASTDPDKDGLPTKWERDWSKTSPTKKDTDKDGIPDGSEDQDKDTLTHRQEYLAGMRPRRADSDRDGIRDDKEDTDKDALKTKFEFVAGTKPKVKDTDKDGLRDDREDPDKDGLTNRDGADPRHASAQGGHRRRRLFGRPGGDRPARTRWMPAVTRSRRRLAPCRPCRASPAVRSSLPTTSGTSASTIATSHRTRRR